MSLTSYRAALPRVRCIALRCFHRSERCFRFFSGLAVTYSPTSFDAVPLARRHLTAEFGMGSGVLLVLWPPDRKRSEIGVIPQDDVVQGCFSKRDICLSATSWSVFFRIKSSQSSH